MGEQLGHYYGDIWDWITIEANAVSENVGGCWAVDGSSSNDIYVGCESASFIDECFEGYGRYLEIVHYNGTNWEVVSPQWPEFDCSSDVRIWVASPSSVFVSISGGGSIFYYNGEAWGRMEPPLGLAKFWGFSEEDIFAATLNGQI